jgi:hypothetical protein
MRNAMAVGASQDGVFLVGPQEGIWTPSSAVLEMQKGDYYGMGPDHLNKDSYKENDKKITPAMAYLPGELIIQPVVLSFRYLNVLVP